MISAASWPYSKIYKLIYLGFWVYINQIVKLFSKNIKRKKQKLFSNKSMWLQKGRISKSLAMAPLENKHDKAFSLLSLSKIRANIENYSYLPFTLVM